jgi:hypothetical protein
MKDDRSLTAQLLTDELAGTIQSWAGVSRKARVRAGLAELVVRAVETHHELAAVGGRHDGRKR